MHDGHRDTTLVLGAGPAGITAAYELARAGIPSLLIEKDGVVGGISRTVQYHGYYFDLGGHRFFTKSKRVEDLWRETLGADLLHRRRMSRIFFDGKLFAYPLRPLDIFFGLSIGRSLSILASYAKAQLSPATDEQNFERWICRRFGRKLFELFFESYTEKVWGVPCRELSADWAAQRIQGLSLSAVLTNAFRPKQSGGSSGPSKTLIESFFYPKTGPGMMWEELTRRARKMGSRIRLQSAVETVQLDGNRIAAVDIRTESGVERLDAEQVISSIPLPELVTRLEPKPPAHILGAAKSLRYRDFLIVALILDGRDLFSDNWIYVHDPSVKLARIQNFNNWSPFMTPDPGKTCLGLEYFCTEGDALWQMADEDLIDLGRRELGSLGLADGAELVDSTVVRVPKAYPIYDPAHEETLGILRRYLVDISNLQLVGRNGMHRYNNQDHSMMTAMLAVENIRGAEHDLWAVNVDHAYHEALSGSENVVGSASSPSEVKRRTAV